MIMRFSETPIPGAFEVHLSPLKDDRGVFTRIFCGNEFEQAGFQKNIVQVNHSVNRARGTVRGMHFQYPPHSEIKIIRCIKGKVFDVVVDIRKNSPTFMQWYAVELSPEKYNMILIPEGCAHGFQALEEDSELLYFHSEFYHPESEGAFRFDDPFINIQWPLPAVQVSAKDKSYPLLDASFAGVAL